jgi:hypothetical protein
MTPLTFALIVAGVVLVCSTPALWLFFRWHSRRVGELHRQAGLLDAGALAVLPVALAQGRRAPPPGLRLRRAGDA